MKVETREDFPLLLNSMGLTGEAAEIGVYEGDYSELILSRWSGKRLYSVDPWSHQGRKLDRSDVSQEEHDSAYAIAKERLSKFKDRSKILRMRSQAACLEMPVSSLDFVYIDACHDYRSVYGDIEIWWGMVKKGGILAGHDYKDSFIRNNLVEVKRCVDNYFRALGRKVLTTTEDNLPSWYVIK